MEKKVFLNDLLKFADNELNDIKIRFCMKNDEPKYAIDDYKLDPKRVNDDWFLWKKNKNIYKVGQIAICLVRIYENDEWLLTSVKRITKVLDVYDKMGFERRRVRRI